MKGAGAKAKRRMRNIMLQPLLQVRIGLYSIILSVLFAVALGAILYFNFAGLINSIVLMTDAEDEVREIFMSYWSGTQLWIYLTFIIYLVANVAVSVLYTQTRRPDHRLPAPHPQHRGRPLQRAHLPAQRRRLRRGRRRAEQPL